MQQLSRFYRQFGDGDSIQTGRQLIIVDVNYDSQILDSPAEIQKRELRRGDSDSFLRHCWLINVHPRVSYRGCLVW